jgi:thiol-disulfide isomerase/thioredoxin
MVREASVVTLERFSSGFTYPDYIAQIKVNKNWFQQLYDNFDLAAEDVEFFRKAMQHPQGPVKMMVIGEDWCPDVYRGMPMMAKIAEAAGIEMRIFPRDSHMDIMNEFLKQGLYASIPTAVFYTGDHQYICHWIERPALAEREMEEIAEKVKAELPADATEQQTRAASRPLNQARFPAWQQESVREIREMLAQNLGL